MCDPIQLQIAHLQDRAAPPIASSHHGTNARRQLRNLERFRHEVVSSRLETSDPVFHNVRTSHHQHRLIRFLQSNAPKERRARPTRCDLNPALPNRTTGLKHSVALQAAGHHLKSKLLLQQPRVQKFRQSVRHLRQQECASAHTRT
jgi:hypothetical protein